MKEKIKKLSLLFTLMVVTMFSIGTLAFAVGFTRQFNPEVDKFGITIGTHDSIMISSSGNKDTFKDRLNASEIINDREVSADVLKGKVTHTVDGEHENLILTETYANIPAASNKYFKFPLYFISTKNMNVYLNSNSGAVIELDSSTANPAFSEEDRQKLLDNVRIAFLAYSTIYQEVGSTYEPHYSNDPVNVSVYSRTGIDHTEYETFNRLGYSNNSEVDTILFTTEKEKITMIEVVIWVEHEWLDPNMTAMCNFTLSMTFDGVIVEN